MRLHLNLLLFSAVPVTAAAFSSRVETEGRLLVTKLASSISELPPLFFLDEVEDRMEEKQPTLIPRPPAIPPPRAMIQKTLFQTRLVSSSQREDGVFAPVVEVAKQFLGTEKLNKIRGHMFSMHSDVIKAFVDTSRSPLGETALKTLFKVADKNGNGKIEKKELAAFLDGLGFKWLKEKHVQGILERADSDGKGFLGYEEWKTEAPRTLRTNLMKLAKQNVVEMGLFV